MIRRFLPKENRKINFGPGVNFKQGTHNSKCLTYKLFESNTYLSRYLVNKKSPLTTKGKRVE